jgi:hypothetical protein
VVFGSRPEEILMAIGRSHIPLYEEIFALPGFLTQPVLTFGFQEVFTTTASFDAVMKRWPRPPLLSAARRLAWILGGLWHKVPDSFKQPDLGRILAGYGISSVDVLDLFDERATYRFDMNQPVPDDLHGAYGTVIDIGSIEHVFDTRTCLENLFRMLKVGGHLLIHTPCNGYFGHGLHTFNPEAIRLAMEVNGFEIVYLAYSSKRGTRLRRPDQRKNVLLWIVGKKLTECPEFTPPQEGEWLSHYKNWE